MVGVAPRTVSRWQDREDFRALVRRLREQMMPEVPTAEGTLVAALNATRGNGQPDWQARITAAKAILATPVTSPEAQEQARRTERIYVSPHGDDDGAPRPTPADPDELHHRGEESEQRRDRGRGGSGVETPRGRCRIVNLHDWVIRELDRIPEGTGAAIYDKDLRLLAERDPDDSAVIIVLDRAPNAQTCGVGRRP